MVSMKVSRVTKKTDGLRIQKLEQIKKIIAKDVEVVRNFSKLQLGARTSSDLGSKILNFLKRRPASLEDLIKSLEANSDKITKELEFLLGKGRIYKRDKYFVVDD